MKRIAMLVAVVMLALAMVGCASGTTSSAESSQGSSETASASSEADSAATTVIQGENAWSNASDAEAAAKSAGVTTGFTLPSPLPIGEYKWSDPHFSSMDKVVEANIDGEVVAVCIRKGEGVAIKDLSADKNDYKADWTQEVDGVKVTCHGYEKDIANFLEWEKDGCSYDVWCVGVKGENIGMNKDEVTAMVKGIK